MSIEEICSLPVTSAKNAVLYLWATVPLLPEALQVIAAWGFTYKSGAVWDKEKPGMGFWWRGQHELLMIAVKGKVSPPAQALRVSSVIRCPRGRHSSKPDIVRDLIASWYPWPRLEMFSRIKRPGWDSFGNEIEIDLLSDP
jgi:N6-adenosine-specific RNA methylase IME4